MPTTGKVKNPGSKPVPHFEVDTGTPPPVVFNVDVDATDFAVVLAAYGKDANVDVSGTAPACTGVTGK